MRSHKSLLALKISLALAYSAVIAWNIVKVFVKSVLILTKNETEATEWSVFFLYVTFWLEVPWFQSVLVEETTKKTSEQTGSGWKPAPSKHVEHCDARDSANALFK